MKKAFGDLSESSTVARGKETNGDLRNGKRGSETIFFESLIKERGSISFGSLERKNFFFFLNQVETRKSEMRRYV